MPRWWKFGFISLLVITSGAFVVHVALNEPPSGGGASVAVPEHKDSEFLNWDWSEEESCEIYERCQFVELIGTHLCPEQILIQMHLEDEKDEWVDSASTVIQSPGIKDSARIELGVNRTDFEYFVIGNIRCTSALPTVFAQL